MKTIFKYKLGMQINKLVSIEIPKGAEVTGFGEQENTFYLWALVDTDKPTTTRNFILVFTGHEVPSNIIKAHSTFQSDSGLVIHLVEVE